MQFGLYHSFDSPFGSLRIPRIVSTDFRAHIFGCLSKQTNFVTMHTEHYRANTMNETIFFASCVILLAIAAKITTVYLRKKHPKFFRIIGADPIIRRPGR